MFVKPKKLHFIPYSSTFVICIACVYFTLFHCKYVNNRLVKRLHRNNIDAEKQLFIFHKNKHNLFIDLLFF